MLCQLPDSYCLGDLVSFCVISYHWPVPESESQTGAAITSKNTTRHGSLSKAFLVLTFPRTKGCVGVAGGKGSITNTEGIRRQ